MLRAARNRVEEEGDDDDDDDGRDELDGGGRGAGRTGQPDAWALREGGDDMEVCQCHVRSLAVSPSSV